MKKSLQKSKNVLSSGANFIHETGKYTSATVEYTGLVTFSLARKGGNAIMRPFVKIVRPLGKINFRKLLPETKIVTTDIAQVRNLEEKVLLLEERLAVLERRGISMPVIATSVKKAVDKKKLDILREIVNANKLLREAI